MSFILIGDRQEEAGEKEICLILSILLFKTRTQASVCQVKWVEVWMVDRDETDPPRDPPCRRNNETSGVWLMCAPMQRAFTLHGYRVCFYNVCVDTQKGQSSFHLSFLHREVHGSGLASENHHLSGEKLSFLPTNTSARQKLVDL